jgi:hypothetical protein
MECDARACSQSANKAARDTSNSVRLQISTCAERLRGLYDV